MTSTFPQASRVLRDDSLTAAAPWTFLSPGPEMLLAVRQRGQGFASDLVCLRPGTVHLAGDLATFPPADLLVTLHALRKSGLLIVSGAVAERAFLLVGGNLAWASSSNPQERGDGGLCRLDLNERAAQLLGRGSGRTLRGEIAEQISTVLRGLAQETQGTFALSTVPLPPLAAEAAFDTQELLLSCVCEVSDQRRGRHPAASLLGLPAVRAGDCVDLLR
ncbi:MAG: hypothetical protein NVSMB23_00580 [Myxococcales bacterium]